MSRLHLRASAPATPLPPINDASPAAPSAGPRAFAFGARKLQYVSEAVHTREKYARCVQRIGRIRRARHVPPTSTAAFSPTSRAGLSRPCDPSPRHAQATAQQAKTLRKHRIAWIFEVGTASEVSDGNPRCSGAKHLNRTRHHVVGLNRIGDSTRCCTPYLDLEL
ncbi:hypothetical protein B0H14DRAFT_3469033 [Mycena olivaceomarginata]|nr:hypothetical protein B0H14DRAFT_3469033 [Mycena olivaceomarginata]